MKNMLKKSQKQRINSIIIRRTKKLIKKINKSENKVKKLLNKRKIMSKRENRDKKH